MRHDSLDPSGSKIYEGPLAPVGDDETGTLPRKRQVSALNWNVALDLWLIAEVTALGLMMALSLVSNEGRALISLGAGWVGAFALLSWYRRSVQAARIRCDRLGTRVADWVKASGLTLAGAFIFLDVGAISRIWAGSLFLLGLLLIIAIGISARAFMATLARKGAIGDRVAIYGCDGDMGALIRAIETGRGPAARVEALWDERHTRGEGQVEGRAVDRSFDGLITQIKENRINAVVLNIPWSATSRISDLVKRLEEVSVDVLMAPAPIQLDGTSKSTAYVGSISTLSLYRRPMIGLQAAGKQVLDRVAAALALLILSPFLFAVAIAIRIDSPGPVLFRQKRRGMNNEPFDMLKFRSMYSHSEDRNADRLVTRGDTRITRFGAFIRRTSLDELPQLFNVLFGQMSLVGPRPHAYGAKAADRLYEQVVSRYPARHRVPPGITGLAQVRGFRGNTGREEDIVNRVESDLEYIDRWTLGLDIVILMRTAATFLFHRDAY